MGRHDYSMIKVMSLSGAKGGMLITHSKRFEFPGSGLLSCNAIHRVCAHVTALSLLPWGSGAKLQKKKTCQ